MLRFSVVLLLLLATSLCQAADYKQWLSLLPESAMGMPRSGDPDGANVTMNDIENSSLTVRYRDGDRTAEIMLIYDSSRSLIMPFEMVRDMQVETPEEIHQPTMLNGFKAIYQLDRPGKQTALIVILSPTMLIQVSFQPAPEKAELMKFVAGLPLKKLAASVQ